MTDLVARMIARALAPEGKRSRLSILIYHRVRAVRDPLFPHELDAAGFDQHLCILSSLFNVLPLEQAIARLRRGTLPERPACITFDDGYADNAEIALPILQRHHLRLPRRRPNVERHGDRERQAGSQKYARPHAYRIAALRR